MNSVESQLLQEVQQLRPTGRPPFSDGNKRIGTLLFLEYLRLNGLLLRADGNPRLADNAMVALALLAAESEPKQKELMIRLTLSLMEDAPVAE